MKTPISIIKNYAELIQLDRLQKKLMRNLLVETDPQAETRRSEDCEESAKSVKAV